MALSYLSGYLLPFGLGVFSLVSILLTLFPSVRNNDSSRVVFSILFFIAGTIRGVTLGLPPDADNFMEGKETVRFIGKVKMVSQSGPLVELVVEGAFVEKVYHDDGLVFFKKILVSTFGKARFYEGWEGWRVVGLGRMRKNRITGSNALYAGRALLSGFSYVINTDRGKLLFFGRKKAPGFRRRMLEKIREGLSIKRERTMGRDFLASILTGEREYNSSLRELLIDSGLAHLLAISGLHVGVAFLFFSFISRISCLLLNRLGFIFDMNIPSLFSGAAVTIAYAYLAGMAVTIERAYAMIIFSAIAVRKYYGGPIFTPMAFAFFVIVISEPSSICSVSFIFSFLITLYLVFLFGDLRHTGAGKGKINLIVSLTAYCVSVPLSAYFFERASMFGFMFNFFFVPLLIPLMGVSLVWAFFCLLGFPGIAATGKGLAWIADKALILLKWSVNYAGPAVFVHRPSAKGLICYFFSVTIIFLLSLKSGKNADKPIEGYGKETTKSGKNTIV